jgi:hypothetical protein
VTEVAETIKSFLASRVVPRLPGSVRGISFEVVAWLVTVHAYQVGVLDDDTFETLQLSIEPLPAMLPPRSGEAWQAVPHVRRVDPVAPIDFDGERVYERCGASVATRPHDMCLDA